mmetsp:Transcript_2790/g.11431  ORF Transcript_2790/g.11431 Transcript_2790/m.11431 type:complete len:174 (+) Transcript_2790:114-635(+)
MLATLQRIEVSWNNRLSRSQERLLWMLILVLVSLKSPPFGQKTCGPISMRPLRGTVNYEQLEKGSCVCGADNYCQCSPSLAIDVVLEQADGRVLLVRRRDNGKLAVSKLPKTFFCLAFVCVGFGFPLGVGANAECLGWSLAFYCSGRICRNRGVGRGCLPERGHGRGQSAPGR